ncbi:unnamed protein product, partial [Prorocentrum cordatum]
MCTLRKGLRERALVSTCQCKAQQRPRCLRPPAKSAHRLVPWSSRPTHEQHHDTECTHHGHVEHRGICIGSASSSPLERERPSTALRQGLYKQGGERKLLHGRAQATRRVQSQAPRRWNRGRTACLASATHP